MCQQSFLLPDWLTVRTRSPRLRGNSRGDRNASPLVSLYVLIMVRGKRSLNFYSDLNNFSTADIHSGRQAKRRCKLKVLKDTFKAERLVARKERKVKFSSAF